jgi:hypothetical protein
MQAQNSDVSPHRSSKISKNDLINCNKNKFKIYRDLISQNQSNEIDKYFSNLSEQKINGDSFLNELSNKKDIYKEFFKWSDDILFAMENNIEIIIGKKFVKNKEKFNSVGVDKPKNEKIEKNEEMVSRNNVNEFDKYKLNNLQDFIKNSYLAYKKNYEESEPLQHPNIIPDIDSEKNNQNEVNFELREKKISVEIEDDNVIENDIDPDFYNFEKFVEDDNDFNIFGGFCQIQFFKNKSQVKKTCSTHISLQHSQEKSFS